jgi:hypothetical protein
MFLGVDVLHSKVGADRNKCLLCVRIFKAKARSFVRAINPPISHFTLGNARSLGA